MSNVRPHKRYPDMPLFKRLRYALYVLIVVTMVVLLALSLGEGVGLVRGFDVERLMFHPALHPAVYAIGFAIAPALSERLPISGDLPGLNRGGKPPFGYTVRSLLLVVSGLVLAVLLGVALFLVERFT